MEAKSPATMKVFSLLILLATPLVASAQNLEIPLKEFNISFSSDALELSRGDTGQLDILILKSSGYRKSKVKMGVSSSLPKGVDVSFNPSHDYFDFTKVNISVQPDATPGQYLLILNATLNHKTKGSILKLLIK